MRTLLLGKIRNFVISVALCFTVAFCLTMVPVQAAELATSSRDSAPFFIVKNGVASGICPDIYAALERVDPSLQIRGASKQLSLSLNERALQSGSEAINCGMGRSPHRDDFCDTPS